ncbi:MAG: CPBP family intramembrane metalloprotease [Ruminococcus sp.]|nr:CPBP family intramembrane metalloprotease [Ruminococcus sp.]
MRKKIVSDLSPFNNRSEMPAGRLAEKKLLAFLLCYIVGFGLAEGLVILLHFALGLNVFKGEQLGPRALGAITLWGCIVPLVITLLYQMKIEKRSLAAIGVTGRPLYWLLGGAAGVLLLGLCVGGALLAGALKYNGTGRPDALLLCVMFAGYAIQGATEEVMSRGLVLGALKDKVPLPLAIGASTLTFVAPHLLSMGGSDPAVMLAGVLNLVLFSVLMCLLTLRTGSLLMACGLHSVWNFVLGSVLGISVSGGEAAENSVLELSAKGNSLLNGGAYGLEASIITTAVLTAAVICLLLTAKNTKKGGK